MAFRILFIGTPDFALPSLHVLHQTTDLVGVITQPDRPAGRKMKLKPSPIAQAALLLDIPTFKTDSPHIILEEIQQLKADCAMVVAYGQILKQVFLDAFPQGAVNLHASLLPQWRGAAPIQRALMAGDTQTGVSLQKMVKKLDAGPVLGQKSYLIPVNMTADQLYVTLSQMGAELIKDVFLKYLRGHLTKLNEQNESLVSYASKIKKEEGRIDFRASAQEIFNQYRGLFMWPGVYIQHLGKRLKIKKMTLTTQSIDPSQKYQPGQVVHISPQAITLSCKKGFIDVLEIQPESKQTMTADQYINGYHIQVGEIW